MKRRLLATLMAACLVLGLLPGSAFAGIENNPMVSQDVVDEQSDTVIPVALADTVASGTCGVNLTWVLDDSGNLTISGAGAMDSFETSDWKYIPPWNSYKNAIKEVVIENGVTSIGTGAFYECINLSIVTLPEGITAIGQYAFFSCAIREIDLPLSLKSIGAFAFDACQYLQSIAIPEGITEIESATFWGCSLLSSVKLPNSLTRLAGRSLSSCTHLNNLIIPDQVTEIGSFAFEGNTNLTYLYIPVSVTSLGYYAFDGCKKLSDIYYPGTEAQWQALVNATDVALSTETTIHCNYIGNAGPIIIDYGRCGENLTWTLNKDNVLEIIGTGDMDDYYGEGAVATAPWASNRLYIKEVLLPDGLTHIGSGAFYEFNIDSINIPSSVKTIGDAAFQFCSKINNIILPDSVTSTGKYTFESCRSLKNAVLPNSIDRIEDGLFQNCASLECINIPSSVTSVGYSAFCGCSNLSRVEIPNSVTTIEMYAFSRCDNLSYIAIPASVSSMEDYVFEKSLLLASAGPIGGGYNCEFGWADCIPDKAFSFSEISSINIPSSITSIGEFAFGACENLDNIAIPTSVTSIGKYAFAGCKSLVNITIPSSISNIEQGTFQGCSKLADISFLSHITRIGPESFEGCSSLKKLDIPTSVTSIGNGAFSNCTNLMSVIIPDGVTGGAPGGAYWFEGCPLLTTAGPIGGNYDIQFGWTEYFPFSALIHTALEQLVIPNGVTYVREYSRRYGDFALSSVVIPGSVTIVGHDAYAYIQNGIDWGLFELHPNLVTAGPIGGNYDIQFGWTDKIPECTFAKSYINEVVLPEGITSIGAYAFDRCKALDTVQLPDSIESIGDGAFRGCPNLTNLQIPNGVKSIRDVAFSGCSSLTNVTIPCQFLGDKAFYGCTSLSSARMLNGLTTIPTSAFSGCASLEYVVIPRSVTRIYDNAFSGCNSITDVYFGGTPGDWLAITVGVNNDILNKAKIHYNSTGPSENPDPGPEFPDIPDIPNSDISIKKIQLPYYSGIGNRISNISVDWGWGLFNRSAVAPDRSQIYSDNRLAVTSLILSNTVEQSDVTTEQLLKDFLGFDETDSKNYDSSANQHPAVTFAYKPLKIDGKVQYIFAVIVRGTSNLDDEWTDISAAWGGFSVAAEHLHSQLSTFMTQNCGNTQSLNGKVKFLVTGHSLGGAVANIMARKLSSLYGAENVFAYTFASPTTIRIAQPAGNIFNLLNAEDGWTYLPGINDHRYGWELRFHRDGAAPFGFYERFKELTGKEFDDDSAHATEVYLSHLLTMPSGHTTKITLLRVLCPVDVELYDSNSRLVGQVKNNIASGTIAGKTYIRVVGDEKHIYLLDNDQYKIKLFSTDNGTMEYSAQNIDVDASEIVTEKTFSNVVLTPGKEFISEISVRDQISSGTNVAKVPLYVIGNAGEPEKEILPDGNGTEVPITKPVNPDKPTGGDATYPSGGNNSGSGTSTPSYSITAPSAPGGMVTISSKSAAMGTTVTITVKPDAGYELLSLTVIDGSNKEIPLTDQGNGKYTFVMPAGKVTVSAEFQAVQLTTVPTPETPWSNPFTDVSEESWYYDAVKFVSENGLMNGISNDVFAPDANLSRAMLAQILYNKEDKPNVAESSTFTDVVPGEWYNDAITWAAANNIVGGYGNGLFGPNDNITREQLAVMLWRYAGESAATSKELHFSDAKEVSNYAISAINWAVGNGVINGKGDNILDPKGFATRAQVAQMLKNYLEK